MFETSKSNKRRFHHGAFFNRYFVGDAIDVGGGSDPLAQYVGVFPLLKSVTQWELDHGDGQFLRGIPAESFDLLHSSHCLEHLVDPREALRNWIRVVRPGGFLVITVPDEDLYEQGRWPSGFNSDHKWTFTIHKTKSWSPRSINVIDLLTENSNQVEIEKIELIRNFYSDSLRGRGVDQTTGPVAECSIEFILQKLRN